jgi:hypothetical protein
MLGTRIVARRGSRDEAEKPFWISFADMMTALMVLFLVVMGVALLAVTKTVNEQDKIKKQRQADIELLLERFSQAAAHYDGNQGRQGSLCHRLRRARPLCSGQVQSLHRPGNGAQAVRA